MSGQRSTALPLSSDHVDVWLISTALPESTLNILASLLSVAERERIDRLRIPAKRIEALVSRGVLRHILGTLLHRHPASLAFGAGPHGKPHLDGELPLQFNLSHTAGWVVLGVTLGQAIGIDIEQVKPRPVLADLARRFFTEKEAASILACTVDNQPHAFFTAWCRKEAVLKAMGQGISAGLNSFEVPTHSVPEAFAVQFAAKDWWVHDLFVGNEPLVASLAVEKCGTLVRQWSWTGIDLLADASTP